MRLCMFHPNDNPLDRGWVGRVDGDRVLHLAAQTLQSLFLGGGSAREHAEYARAVSVRLAGDGETQDVADVPFAWDAAVALAARRTILRPGDVVAGPPVAVRSGVDTGVILELDGIGTLDCPLA